MNELLEAAKAVIDAEDIPTRCNAISKLRSAVERAENTIKETDAYEHGYTAGQKAMRAHERERIKAIIKAVGVQGSHDALFDACDTILEKIDE